MGNGTEASYEEGLIPASREVDQITCYLFDQLPSYPTRGQASFHFVLHYSYHLSQHDQFFHATVVIYT